MVTVKEQKFQLPQSLAGLPLVCGKWSQVAESIGFFIYLLVGAFIQGSHSSRISVVIHPTPCKLEARACYWEVHLKVMVLIRIPKFGCCREAKQLEVDSCGNNKQWSQAVQVLLQFSPNRCSDYSDLMRETGMKRRNAKATTTTSNTYKNGSSTILIQLRHVLTNYFNTFCNAGDGDQTTKSMTPS